MSTQGLQGIAPASEEAEVSVLGAMLIDADARALALSRLEPADFHFSEHPVVFSALRRLHGRGFEGDVVTLSDELDSADELEAAGGMRYLAQLVDAVPTAANVEYHADRLRELQALRETQAAGEALIQEAHEAGPGEAATVLEAARDRLRELNERAVESREDGLRTLREILEDPDTRQTPVTVAELLAWAGRTTLLAGRDKSGKSTLLRWALARRSQGLRVWEGAPVGGPLTVLCWGQEADGDVASDLERMGANLDRIHYRDMRLHGGDRFALLSRDLDRVEPALVAVDTLSTFVDRMDLDPGSSADWEPVMNRFGALAQEVDAAVVLNHHARKSDGEYRDSTAIGAGVDCILELRRAPAEGESVRSVTARARSALPAGGFRYALHEAGGAPRLELIDGHLSLEERVQRFVARHEGCSQRDVLDGVHGRTETIREALRELSENVGPLVCDNSSTPYRYSVPQKPRGNGTETLGNGPVNGSTDSGGRSVSGSAPPLLRRGALGNAVRVGGRRRPLRTAPRAGGDPVTLSPELEAAGVDPDCCACHEAVRHDREACAEHYVPTHRRIEPRECPSCGGAKAADDDRCRRCRARR